MASSLKDIVETIYLEGQSVDSIFRNKERYLMYRHAKDGMKKLGLAMGMNVKGMNARIPSSCKIYKPTDFQTFIRAYLIDCNGKTIELSVNSKVPTDVKHFLLDCDGSVISDQCGSTLYDDCLVCNTASSPDACCGVCSGTGKYLSCESLDFLEDIKKYADSWISERDEYFEFSSDLEEMAVVIEYVANQLADVSECQIMVKDEMEEALQYYIKYKILEGGMETMNQAQYFKRMYKNIKQAETTKQNALQVNDILKTLAL